MVRPDSNQCTFTTLGYGANDNYDFACFVYHALEDGFLASGDTLILDNARIHHAKATLPGLVANLNRRGISILFLPAYSPELNPCELVFAQVKRWVRDHRERDGTFIDILSSAFALVDRQNIVNYYRKCLRHFAEHGLPLPPSLLTDIDTANQ
jgi:transposase